MQWTKQTSLILGTAFVWWIAGVQAVSAQYGGPQQTPPQLDGVRIEEKLGKFVDLNLTFVGTDGYEKPLKTFFQGRPVILNLVYYNCPMLCNLVLNGQVDVMRQIPWTPGEEYDIVTITIDPNESWDLAKKKQAIYLSSFDRPAPGWHFLADHQDNVRKLADQVGFYYKYDPRIGQYAHAAAMIILTPEGKVSRYLYGVKYKARDVRLALTEAGESKIGKATMAMDRLMLFCYKYDPQAGSYVLFATNVMRGGGALTVLIVATILWRLFRAERHRQTWRDANANGGVVPLS
jgi:protein SCO1/2